MSTVSQGGSEIFAMKSRRGTVLQHDIYRVQFMFLAEVNPVVVVCDVQRVSHFLYLGSYREYQGLKVGYGHPQTVPRDLEPYQTTRCLRSLPTQLNLPLHLTVRPWLLLLLAV